MKFKSFLGKRLAPILFILALVISMIPVQAFAKTAYDPKEDFKELQLRFWEDQQPDVGFYINASSRYILETVTAPQMGSTFGEWSVMDLLRGMNTGYDYINYIPENYFDDYLQRIEGYVIGKEGNLDRNKSTEWSRLILALSSLGYDITSVGTPGNYFKTYYTKNTGVINAVKIEEGSVINLDTPVKIYASTKKYVEIPAGTYTLDADTNTITDSNGEVTNLAASQFLTIENGYDFINKLSESYKFSYRQGINGPIWEIIAMNTGGYKFIEDETKADTNKFGKMIGYILNKEITQADGTVGGWALSGKIPDPDITGMALQALAPYYLDRSKYEAENVYYEDTKGKIEYSYEDFAQAVERAVLALSTIQQPNAGYGSWGSDNSESIVQVIVALTALGIDPLQENIELPHIDKTTDFITEGEERDGVTTNNMIDALLAFWAEGSGSSPEVGGFKHVKSGYDGGGGSGTTVNAMATDQALYGLIAYDRFKKGEKPLYDMTDMTSGQYKNMKAKTYTVNYVGKTPADIKTETYSPYAVIELPNGNDPVNLKTFSGWNTKEDGSGVKYEAGELLSMPEEDITLYAQYEYSTDKIIEALTALPEVTDIQLSDLNSVEELRQAYTGLSKEQQALVTNYKKLEELEAKLSEFKQDESDKEKAQNVIDTINALPKLEDLKLEQKAAVDNARKAYDELTERQKASVTNYQNLVELEKKIEELEKSNEELEKDKVVAQKVIDTINALPKLEDLKLEQKATVNNARKAYDELTERQKALVINYQNLLELEKRIQELKDVPLKLQLNEVSDKDKTVTGQTEADSKVEVKVNDSVIGSETADKDGNFNITIKVQKAGTTISVYATDSSGERNATTTVKVVDKTAPSVPTVNVVSDKSTTITGKAETNAKVYAMVGSKKIGEATAKNGTYTIKISKQKVGTTITVYAVDAAKNQSANKTVKVVDKTAPSVPTANTVSDKSVTITGKAEKNAKVYVVVGSKKIGETTAKNGTYTIKISKQKAGTTISVYVVDAAGNKSANKTVKVVDKTAPSVPTVKAVSDKSTTITGKTEKNAKVYALVGSKKIGVATAKNGTYTIKIKKQKAGTTITVYAVDTSGNKSGNKKIKVVDKTAPSVPTVNKVTSKSVTVSGKGEKGATIYIYNGNKKIGQGTVNNKGIFKVKIKAQKKGSTIKVYAKDKAGNKSKNKTIKVK